LCLEKFVLKVKSKILPLKNLFCFPNPKICGYGPVQLVDAFFRRLTSSHSLVESGAVSNNAECKNAVLAQELHFIARTFSAQVDYYWL